MPTTKKPPKETLRSWRVAILRNRDVQRRTRRAAEAAAAAQFGLNNEQRKRVALQEMDG
jgi:hypothetical protein